MKIKKKTIFHQTKFAGETKSGALYAVAAVAVIGLFGTALSAGIIPTLSKLTTPAPPGPAYTCCDSGDGPDCHPLEEKTITYKNPKTGTTDTYALLKSNVFLGESMHIVPVGLANNGQEQSTPDGQRIFINTTDHTANYSYFKGCDRGKDLVRMVNPTNPGVPCFGIPDEQVIYACRDTKEKCAVNVNLYNNRTPFDVYFRVKDGAVPSEMSTYCPKPKGVNTKESKSQQVIAVPTAGGRKNLQLETFQIKQQEKQITYFTPWCKPAIYLYPPQETIVNVQVASKGILQYTDPVYPSGGWTVTAFPDGKILSNNKIFPYLYYESPIPDSEITEPKEGYVVTHAELQNLFNTVLPALGLNQKETSEFSEYWLKALPRSPFYFVGILDQQTINNIAKLTINPTPDNVLRVSLYFKALENNIDVPEPQVDTRFNRTGFTVTEWGGMVKIDKNHPFTCLM